MPTAPVIDVAALLAPIPGDLPAGIPLAASAWELDEINQLLPRPDRAVDETIEISTKADWRLISKLASRFLQTKSKDLRVALRLTQALIHLHGFAGLRDGLMLLSGLLDKYWEGLAPLPDEDTGDLESRAAPLLALCLPGLAPVWIGNIPLSPQPLLNVETGAIRDATYNLNREIRDNRQDQAQAFEAVFDDAIQATPDSFFVKVNDDLNAALQELDKFQAIALERFGNELSPCTQRIAESVLCIRWWLQTLCKHRRVALRGPVFEPELPAEDYEALAKDADTLRQAAAKSQRVYWRLHDRVKHDLASVQELKAFVQDRISAPNLLGNQEAIKLYEEGIDAARKRIARAEDAEGLSDLGWLLDSLGETLERVARPEEAWLQYVEGARYQFQAHLGDPQQTNIRQRLLTSWHHVMWLAESRQLVAPLVTVAEQVATCHEVPSKLLDEVAERLERAAEYSGADQVPKLAKLDWLLRTKARNANTGFPPWIPEWSG